LSYAGLERANLQRADLRGARLWAVRATGADFAGADLRGAQLGTADLSGARLAGADLRGARLAGTNLVQAELLAADLRETRPDPSLSMGVIDDAATRWPAGWAREEVRMPDVIVGEADQGKPVEVRQGGLLRLRLPENPTTGYQWTMAADNPAVSALLSLVRKDFVAPTGGAAGASGERELVFAAQAAGGARLRLVLKRPWLADTEADRRFEIGVTVVP
jgi:predicted secreted protein